ncbi:MAG: hypothetical protein WC152_01880 [Candidatus Izemoplasmatales bacterium]|nr:hypothetical protein [Candidatus Izemoplasmatales bacterium]
MELEYMTLSQLLSEGRNLGINVVFEFYHTATDTGTVSFEYRNSSNFISSRNYMSMKYQNNEYFNPTFLNEYAFGTISYMNDLHEFLLTVDEYVRMESIPPLLW